MEFLMIFTEIVECLIEEDYIGFSVGIYNFIKKLFVYLKFDYF